MGRFVKKQFIFEMVFFKCLNFRPKKITAPRLIPLEGDHEISAQNFSLYVEVYWCVNLHLFQQ
jgi:hypothetical protein